MRSLALVPLALLAAACLPPGVPDPTRYPPRPGYCVVSLDLGSAAGIGGGGGNAAQLACISPRRR